MLVVEVCTLTSPSMLSRSAGSPLPASVIATNDCHVSVAYRWSVAPLESVVLALGACSMAVAADGDTDIRTAADRANTILLRLLRMGHHSSVGACAPCRDGAQALCSFEAEGDVLAGGHTRGSE